MDNRQIFETSKHVIGQQIENYDTELNKYSFIDLLFTFKNLLF